MTTRLTEMLELPNFAHMTTSTKSFASGKKILLMTSCIETMTSYPLSISGLG